MKNKNKPPVNDTRSSNSPKHNFFKEKDLEDNLRYEIAKEISEFRKGSSSKDKKRQ